MSNLHNLKAIWDDTSEELQSEQIASLAFMAIHNEVEDKDSNSSDES